MVDDDDYEQECAIEDAYKKAGYSDSKKDHHGYGSGYAPDNKQRDGRGGYADNSYKENVYGERDGLPPGSYLQSWSSKPSCHHCGAPSGSCNCGYVYGYGGQSSYQDPW